MLQNCRISKGTPRASALRAARVASCNSVIAHFACPSTLSLPLYSCDVHFSPNAYPRSLPVPLPQIDAVSSKVSQLGSSLFSFTSQLVNLGIKAAEPIVGQAAQTAVESVAPLADSAQQELLKAGIDVQPAVSAAKVRRGECVRLDLHRCGVEGKEEETNERETERYDDAERLDAIAGEEQERGRWIKV